MLFPLTRKQFVSKPFWAGLLLRVTDCTFLILTIKPTICWARGKFMPLSTPPRKKAEAFYPVFSGDAMWEIDSNLQILSFLYAVLAGGIFSVFYDVLKSVRLSFKCSAITVFFQDIFYFAVVAVAAFCFLLSQSGGEIRLYIIFGFILGFIILRLTFSRILVPVLSGVLKFILKIY